MLRVNNLHIDYEATPVGLDHAPQFGWALESDRRNVLQTAYHLQIGLDAAFSELLYDSGLIQSPQSAHIALPLEAAVKLVSSKRYYLRVQVEAGAEQSGWSAATSFVTALLQKKEWCAPFVSAETNESYKDCSKGTLVRGRFFVKKPLRAAFAHTTALGLYNFYLNGQKAGADEMAPGWTSYHHHLLYQTTEVTTYLQQGENVAGAMLGAGWYKGVMGLTKARNNYGDQTAFAMQLVLDYQDGTRETVTTDADWQGADAPIVFSEIYDGEIYDGALEIPDWSTKMTESASWRSVAMVPQDTSILCAQPEARVRVMDTLAAKSLFKTPKGEQVVDFGQNMAGRILVTASGKAGDVIELRCFEVLDSEGNVYVDNLRKAKTTATYIFGEEKTVSWHPCFTFMGFRYAHVVRYPGTPTVEHFTAQTLHSRMSRTGRLTTSSPLLNQLHQNILWGLKGNFLDVPTDCPQRDERLGWTGDAQIFCRTACYLTGAYTFFKKWLVDVAVDQTTEGGVAHVVPNIEYGRTDQNWLLSQGPDSAAAWADVAVIAPWTLYLMYGDKEVLHAQYSSMKGWVDFMKAHSEDYIWNYKLQFGDWVALDAEPGSYFGKTPNDITCTAYFAYSTQLFAKAARALEKHAVADEYEALHAKIVEKFQNTFFNEKGDMTAQTQTAHIVALYFGLVPQRLRAQTVEGLKRLLAEQDGHLVTGFVGTPYFCHALSQNGCIKEAYDLLLKEDFPSWLYQVKMGATTIWEHWDGIKPDGSMWSADMNSFNHYAYGAIGEWMYRVMAGIETDECRAGFAHSVLYPRMGGGLQFVEGAYTSIYGKIATRWELDGEQATLWATVPAGTTATLRLDNAKEVLENDGLTFQKREGYWEAETGSGSYVIRFLRNAQAV